MNDPNPMGLLPEEILNKGHSNITSDLLIGRVLKKLDIINKVSFKE